MTKVRYGLLLAVIGLLLLTVWLWWNRPRVVEISEYAPADALVYLEVDDVPRLAETLASTEAWRETARVSNSNLTSARIKWLSRLMRYTGIGTAEGVLLARAKVAACVLGVEARAATESAEELALNIKPRLAVILASQMTERRTQRGLESLIARFMTRNFTDVRLARATQDDFNLTTWTAQLDGGEKQILLAVQGDLAIVANDRAALEACLATARGTQGAMAADAELNAMRERTKARDLQDRAAAFAYVSSKGANALFQLFAPLYATQVSVNPKIQSAAAALLPQLAARYIGGAAWTMRRRDNRIEDFFFFKTPPSFAADLQTVLPRSADDTPSADAATYAALLPVSTAQATCYATHEPAATWDALNRLIAAQLDSLTASLATGLLEKSLTPFGIERPRELLPALKDEIWTARLDAQSPRTLLIARIADRARLERELRRTFGNPRPSNYADATIYVAAPTPTSIASDEPFDDMRRAAVITNDVLLLGDARDLRLCLLAHRNGETLAKLLNTDTPAARPSIAAPAATTYNDHRSDSRAILERLLRLEKNSLTAERQRRLIETVTAAHPYTVTRTHLAADGIERRTVSNFGQLGRLLNDSE